LGRVLLRLQVRRLPLPGQVFEAVRVERRLVELAALIAAISYSGGYPTSFSTRRLSSALAIGGGEAGRRESFGR
jgi:hypothetical protein